jgi:hypothetical protein
MLSTCVNRLSPQTISRVPAVCLPLLGGQNGGEGDNMRVRLRLVMRNQANSEDRAQLDIPTRQDVTRSSKGKNQLLQVLLRMSQSTNDR